MLLSWFKSLFKRFLKGRVRRGDPKEIFRLFDRMSKDEELANLLDAEIRRRRSTVVNRRLKKPVRAKFKPKTRYEKKLWRENADIDDLDD